MSIKELNPYLNFNGNAAKAAKFYESALGCVIEQMQRFGDIPNSDAPPETRDRVMHAVLRFGNAGVIMMSDTMPGMEYVPGSNNYVALHWDDPEEMTQRFAALSEGGQVTMPLNDTFWGAKFGMLNDAFGVRWMFNCDLKKG